MNEKTPQATNFPNDALVDYDKRIKELFQILGKDKSEGIECIYSDEFKYEFETKYTRRPLLEFFEKNPNKNLGVAYSKIKQKESFSHQDLIKSCLEIVKSAKLSIRQDNSPQLFYCSNNPYNE